MKLDLEQLQVDLEHDYKQSEKMITKKDEQLRAFADVGIGGKIPHSYFKPDLRFKKIIRKCLADKCDKPGKLFGYCRKHYDKVANGYDVDEIPWPKWWYNFIHHKKSKRNK